MQFASLRPEAGIKLLDLSEEQAKETQQMGQWADDVWDKAHASKLPFGYRLFEF